MPQTDGMIVFDASSIAPGIAAGLAVAAGGVIGGIIGRSRVNRGRAGLARAVELSSPGAIHVGVLPIPPFRDGLRMARVVLAQPAREPSYGSNRAVTAFGAEGIDIWLGGSAPELILSIPRSAVTRVAAGSVRYMGATFQTIDLALAADGEATLLQLPVHPAGDPLGKATANEVAQLVSEITGHPSGP